MIQNQEEVSELEGQVRYISHVHISEPGLKTIEERNIHRELKELLLAEHYTGYISVEMGKTDILSELDEILRYVKEVF